MDEQKKALSNLKLCYELCVWFMQTYGDYRFEPKEYVAPVEYTVNLAELEQENQELEARNQELLIQLNDIRKQGKADQVRRLAAYQRAENIYLTEAQTRELVDEQLRRVGWEADTVELRYSNGVRPKRGRNLAIAEFPTDSAVGNRGFADYALFIGEKMVGLIEVKRKHSNISSVLDYQCKDYAENIKAEHRKYIIKDFGKYKVPFLFATNGRGYIRQYEEMSGIWYLDTRQSFNVGKPLAGWFSPDAMLADLERDIEEADKQLLSTGYELLQDENGLSLRDYQIEAIKEAEKAIIQDKKTEVLLAMATGTGKTRTVLGMIYRFLLAKRFRRILYLVDRTALGDQASDTFKTVRLEDLKTLNELYDVKDLGEKEIERDTRLVIATVQSLVKRIVYNDSEHIPGASDFDLIIVDEAHRGYILDKDMSDDEVLYRNQDDFRSKYRAVIDYFDAVKIALTATPALHTTEIFGKPIYTYDYRTAVIDGYLVDHDAPHIIHTKLSEEGITFEAGSTPPVYDPTTNTVVNGDELEDELKFDINDFNKSVVNSSFNETVLEEIVNCIDPNEDGKTLIFAVDDAHADRIVHILKTKYTKRGISEEAITKITGSIENGNPKKIRQAIRRFKNEIYPKIVVTVDLLTTGIDIEEITNLVFMRRIKSRILFEQMLGRATRLCPRIGKTHFEIYDAVRIYDALAPLSTMKPVVVNPNTPLETLIDGIENLHTNAARQNQIDMVVAKIRRLKGRMSDGNREQFQSLANGKSVEDVLDELKSVDTKEAVEKIKQYRNAFDFIKVEPKERVQFISDAEDKMVSHERGYGDARRPEDYLKEFSDFIAANMNEIAALNIVATRPRDLTRESLKELKLILDRNHFNETMLQTAWREMTNEDIAADIISFIRQQSIGDALISKDERIHNAIEKTKKAHPELTKIQTNWLTRIEKYLKKIITNIDSLD